MVEHSDFFENVDRLEQILLRRSQFMWADRLLTAVRGGATSGEILDSVSDVLVRLMTSGVAKEAECEREGA